MNLFARIFAEGTRKHPQVTIHSMGAYLDEYGRGGMTRSEILDNLRMADVDRKEMHRLFDDSDASADKVAYAQQVEMYCQIERLRGPDEHRFYSRLWGARQTVKPTARRR